MSFRRLPTDREYWSRFCGRNGGLIEALDSIAIGFASPDRFEELLQSGVTGSKDATAELSKLSNDEWLAFNGFVEHFRRDWQSYFVETLYPAYFREVQRRAAPLA